MPRDVGRQALQVVGEAAALYQRSRVALALARSPSPTLMADAVAARGAGRHLVAAARRAAPRSAPRRARCAASGAARWPAARAAAPAARRSRAACRHAARSSAASSASSCLRLRRMARAAGEGLAELRKRLVQRRQQPRADAVAGVARRRRWSGLRRSAMPLAAQPGAQLGGRTPSSGRWKTMPCALPAARHGRQARRGRRRGQAPAAWSRPGRRHAGPAATCCRALQRPARAPASVA